MNTEFQTTIIDKMRVLRDNSKLSQRDLASMLDVSEAVIGNIESPRFKHKYTLPQLWDARAFLHFEMIELFLSDEEINQNKDDLINVLISKIIEYERGK